MSTLGRRLTALEQTAWERRKRRILRDAFADVARDRRWTPDRFEREVQAALDDFARLEPAVRAMCRQGKTVREVAVYLAAEVGVDVDELLSDVERRGLVGSARRR